MKARIKIPFILSQVQCGFPSPADDFIDEVISIDEKVIKNPHATFFARAKGDSMAPIIMDGDILIIDKSVKPSNGKIVLAVLDGEFTAKRFYQKSDHVLLVADNQKYRNLRVGIDRDFFIWGVVTFVFTENP